jgi:hypothetical protein
VARVEVALVDDVYMNGGESLAQSCFDAFAAAHFVTLALGGEIGAESGATRQERRAMIGT